MEATKYFIERKDSGRWLRQSVVFYGNDMINGDCEFGFTENPFEARSYDSYREAESFLRSRAWATTFGKVDCHITEQIFKHVTAKLANSAKS